MSICGRDYEIEAGTGVFVEPFEPHSFKSAMENSVLIIELSYDVCRGFSEWLKEFSASDRKVSYSQVLYSYLCSLLPQDSASASRSSVNAIAAVLSQAFMDNCHYEVRREEKRDVVFEALQYISLNFKEDISLESIARAVGMNGESLSRKFSATVNVSIPEYIRYLRVCSAAMMLQRGFSVSESAFGSGFSSLRTFNRSFKKTFGVTPTEYSRESEIEGSLFCGTYRS